MKLRKWLDNWDMTSLRIKTPILDMEWNPQIGDRNAAWELYIELLTRITTQPLLASHGDEKTALDSVYAIFPLTRETIKRHGQDCIEFTKIAIVVLNQVVRPFTAKWHKLSLEGAFNTSEGSALFRSELEVLQVKLRRYTRMLADMAGVEDLTDVENVE